MIGFQTAGLRASSGVPSGAGASAPYCRSPNSSGAALADTNGQLDEDDCDEAASRAGRLPQRARLLQRPGLNQVAVDQPDTKQALSLLNQRSKRPASPHSSRQPADSAHSPGYHSAASSPSGSSVASPVSSSSGVSSIGSSTLLLHQHQSSRNPNNQNQSEPADGYCSTDTDGTSLSWFHGANSRARLSAALSSNKLIIAGDISLAEMSRYPVPIMARPPLGVSDLTLDNWLSEVARAQPQRGVKLTFTSTRTVEPAFRVLARHADHLRGPLILSADVLASDSGSRQSNSKQQQQQQPVDAWTFLMLCRTRFPRCIISIGWCQSTGHQWSMLDTNNGASFAELDSAIEAQLAAAIAQPAALAPPTSASAHHTHNQLQQQLRQQPMGHLSGQYAAHNGAQTKPTPTTTTNTTTTATQQQLNPFALNHNHNHHHHHHHHHMLAASTGSLSSSSGNSSGSPSPTSPIGHLMSPHCGATNLSLANLRQQTGSGVAQADSKRSAQAAAIAAAMVAANFHQQQQQQHQQQQLPLNLNINEAALAHAGDQSMAMSQLAQRIQAAPTPCWPHKRAALAGSSPSPKHPNQLHPNPNQQSFCSNLLLKTTTTSVAPNIGNIVGHTTITTQSSSTASLSSTTLPNNNNNNSNCYTREMIDKMAALVKEYNLSQPVTFPVEARLLRNSLGELQRLLVQVGPNSTLTVVAQPNDLISVDDLLAIRKAFSVNQLLYDLPDQLAAAFRHELDLL